MIIKIACYFIITPTKERKKKRRNFFGLFKLIITHCLTLLRNTNESGYEREGHNWLSYVPIFCLQRMPGEAESGVLWYRNWTN